MARSAPVRPQRQRLAIRAADRPVARSKVIDRTLPALAFQRPDRLPLSMKAPEFSPEPYVDYGRFLTPEGGILFRFKDLDLRFRHTVWRVLAWSVSTGFEGWLAYHDVKVHNPWIRVACLLVAAILNLLIVAKPVEIHRFLEIRPDCMIIDGVDVFWLGFIEGARLEFVPEGDGNHVLCGVYGTRFIEYLTVRRFDELDRTPEVFAAHLCEAMKQLWEPPS